VGEEKAVAAFISRWRDAGGGERANYQMFLTELCHLIGADLPKPSVADDSCNTYVFERRVPARHEDESITSNYIDLYRRDCFVLEAKQSRKRQWQEGERPGRAWDTLMRQAREQAEGYARRLPVEEGWPPFLVVVDVGRAIELYADFSLQGKFYAQFPDRSSHRITLNQLGDAAVREKLRLVWQDPMQLNPARRTAQVTRDIASLLARLSTSLEAKLARPVPQTVDPIVAEKVAMFLMRCLFTMFAGSVGLLKRGAFHAWLARYKGRADKLHIGLARLWAAMDRGQFSPELESDLLHFNGGLFQDASALPLDEDELELLLKAAARDWKDVEPAIFGTLLERALSPAERHRLGAHYTPRVYVERLVTATIIDPLSEDWRSVQAAAAQVHAAGDVAQARRLVREFHHKLCGLRILDPACGTGNFLYVAMELLKRLEGEVLNLLVELGEKQERLHLTGETVDPHQFLGLEINPRAVAIAELVLWIGYLQWHFRTFGSVMPAEPVLKNFQTIQRRDAILAYEAKELERDERGRPLTRWDGVTYKPHPITGEQVPDETAQKELYRYHNPRPAPWPAADFIVGNPPYIAGKDMRQEFGDGYAEACWQARPHIPGGADYVMHFWDKAAELARSRTTRRFGFITTNSITQTFSRRVIQRHLEGRDPLGLVMAIPDHPWMKAADRADVRIAMTVAEADAKDGLLLSVTAEEALDSDAPRVLLQGRRGTIQADLSIGAAVLSAKALRSNEAICSPGVKLHGAGFIVTPREAAQLGLGRVPGLEKHILHYRNGRDLTARPRGVMVIDLYPLEEAEVRRDYKDVYNWLYDHVRPEREHNSRASYREQWWIFGEPRRELRQALKGLPRYIATVETTKHRVFQFLDAATRPDNMLVAVAASDAYSLGILSSRIHIAWALAAGGRLGVGNDPRYNKTRCFDPFPFPGTTAPALQRRIAQFSEDLDAHRKDVLRRHPQLTMTGLYNVLEKHRAGVMLTAAEADIYDAGQVGVLRALHDDIDAAVAEAYGWPRDLAVDAIVERLVALNQARVAEERDGLVRWLRPEFQAPAQTMVAAKARQIEAELLVASAARPRLPGPLPEQVAMVRALLRRAPHAVSSRDLAAEFSGRGNRNRVADILEALTLLGQADRIGDRYRLSGD